MSLTLFVARYGSSIICPVNMNAAVRAVVEGAGMQCLAFVVKNGIIHIIVDPLSSTHDRPIIRASIRSKHQKRLTVGTLPYRNGGRAARYSLRYCGYSFPCRPLLGSDRLMTNVDGADCSVSDSAVSRCVPDVVSHIRRDRRAHTSDCARTAQ